MMDAAASTLDRTAAYLDMQKAVAAWAVMLTDATRVAVHGQWQVLDSGPGAVTDGARAVIDPEALLLVSLWLIPRDTAVGATVHAWVARWSDLLSVQRTRNIAKAFPDDAQHQLRAVAVTAHERGKDFRWSPVINSRGSALRTGDDESARPSTHDTPTGAPQERLAVAHDAMQVLRFRMAFGVGVRADALAFLLARGSAWSTVTEIALATGYTPSAIRRALDRMAEAEIIRMLDDGATRYRCDPASWAVLLGISDPVAPWQYWLQRFTFITRFVEWADGVAKRKLTAYAMMEGLRSIARTFRPTDDREAVRVWDHAFRDGSTLPEMGEALAGLAAQLELFNHFEGPSSPLRSSES